MIDPLDLLRRLPADPVDRTALRDDLQFSWLYTDDPLALLPVADWIRLFQAVGFFSTRLPTGWSYAQPVRPVAVYRGSAPNYVLRPSWCMTRMMAEKFRDGAERRGASGALVYRAVVPPTGVLAILFRKGDGGAEIVVDPSMLSSIRPVSDADPLTSDGFTRS